MTYDSQMMAMEADVSPTALFNGLSGNSILVKADSPRFTIVAATPDYIKNSGYSGRTLVGMGVFEAFPANSADPKHNGDTQLFNSFEQVIAHREAHFLPAQRYDLLESDGSFVEKHWRARNSPVFAPDGEVAYIIHTAEDITDQVKAGSMEERIKGMEQAYNLFLQAPIPVCFLTGPDLVIELANAPTLQLWGRGQEVIGLPLAIAIPEVIGQGFLEIINAVRERGIASQVYEAPVSLIRNGTKETLYINYVYEPYYENGQETPVGVLAIGSDVTDKVKVKKLLEESEAKFRTMAESTPVLIAVGDESSNATYFNKAWTNLTGRPMEELLQFGWADLVHSDDRDRYINVYLDAFAIKGPFTGEFRVQNPQGEFRWLLAHGVPRYTSDGNFVGYISACTDITEHKSIQQELETALEQVRLSKEAAELGTFDMDLEAGTMHWDERCRTLFGIRHNEPVTYERDFANGLHPEDRERILKVIDQLFVKSISNGDYDVEYRTVGAEDGIVRWVRAKGKVYFDQSDKPIRFIGSVLDITDKNTALEKIERLVEQRTQELAAANRSLQTMNNELQRSNQNLEEFAHAASHDLKEPVRKVVFFTNLLKDQLSEHLSEKELNSFARIENATGRMRNLIDDLLLYSHVSESPIEKEDVDLNQKLRNVLDDLELSIAERKAMIHVGDLPIVKGYKRQLQQLFQNLIGNSLKYSKTDEPPIIEIRASLVVEAGQTYHAIAVKDNGIGFDPEQSEKIFKMFARLHTDPKYAGTGIGLSIVKKVVENHNGIIRVESAPGSGSTFTVLLPA